MFNFPRTVFLKNLICSPLQPAQSYHNTHVYFSFARKSPAKSWSFTWKFLVFVIHFFIDSTKFTSNLIPFKPFHDTLWHLKLNFLSIFRVFSFHVCLLFIWYSWFNLITRHIKNTFRRTFFFSSVICYVNIYIFPSCIGRWRDWKEIGTVNVFILMPVCRNKGKQSSRWERKKKGS